MCSTYPSPRTASIRQPDRAPGEPAISLRMADIWTSIARESVADRPGRTEASTGRGTTRPQFPTRTARSRRRVGDRFPVTSMPNPTVSSVIRACRRACSCTRKRARRRAISSSAVQGSRSTSCAPSANPTGSISAGPNASTTAEAHTTGLRFCRAEISDTGNTTTSDTGTRFNRGDQLNCRSEAPAVAKRI